MINHYNKTITIALITPCKVFLKHESHTGYMNLPVQFYKQVNMSLA